MNCLHNLFFFLFIRPEDDALSEREFLAVIDGAGRTSHIRFPRIGTALTTTAGLFRSTERTADLSTRRTDVHVTGTPDSTRTHTDHQSSSLKCSTRSGV